MPLSTMRRTHLANIFDGLDFVNSPESRCVERIRAFEVREIVGGQAVVRHVGKTLFYVLFQSIQRQSCL